MTDEEISRRVAEIEGWRTKPTPAARVEWIDADGCNWGLNTPPYATNWAWCGPLVEKYWIRLSDDNDHPERPWAARVMKAFMARDALADTPQRAICLAVIAAHEGKG